MDSDIGAKHVMIDIETLGVRPGAAIVSIGAVVFDLQQGALGKEWYEVVNDYTGHIERSTVDWWVSDKSPTLPKAGRDLGNALLGLNQFLSYIDPIPLLWAKSPHFDKTLLESAYRRTGVKWVWEFWMWRCYRTFVGCYPLPPQDKISPAHHALADAKVQALNMISAYQHSLETGSGTRS